MPIGHAHWTWTAHLTSLFMTVGGKQAIELAVDILAKPNANVLLPKPGFPWDMVRTIYKKLEVRKYDFIPEKDYEIDLESVRAQVMRTRLRYL